MMCLKDSYFELWLFFSLFQQENCTLKLTNIYKIHLKVILCFISVVAGESNMKHNDGLNSLRRFLKLGETHKS